VSVRATCQVRSNQWPSSIVASSAATFSISTYDPSLSVMSAPMPTLVLGLRSASAIPFNLGQAMPLSAPVWRAPPTPVPIVPKGEAEAAAEADAGAAPEAAAEVDAAAESPLPADQREQLPAEAEAVDRPPPDETASEASDPPKAPSSEAATPAEATPDQPEATPSSEAKPGPERQSRAMEFMIDSLPHHTLAESIPVMIKPLGDGVFTAALRDLTISATGHTIAEALLVLKEQIEYLYDDLSKQPHLDSDDKAMLKGLRVYIPMPRKQTAESSLPPAPRMRSLFR
jgi:hypothetical protein